MEDKKTNFLVRAKNISGELKTDANGALFTKEKINDRLFKRFKKSHYIKDKKLVKLIANIKDFKAINKNNKITIPIRLDYVEKRDIDRSTLSSIDGPSQRVHANIGNLEFLGKSGTYPKYYLLIVDIFPSKTYTYPMKSRRNLAKKLNDFHIDVSKKRKNKKVHLQADQEFQQNEIKKLNEKF